MTPSEHTAQRDRVAASLRADDLRETHRAVYPIRAPHAGQDAAQTPRFEPMRPMRNVVRKSGRWT